MTYVAFVAALRGRVYHVTRSPDAIITATLCGRESLPPIWLDQIQRKKLRPCRICFTDKAHVR